MWVFPLGAAGVSAVFAVLLLIQWAVRRRPNLLAWAVALARFAIASGAAAIGMLGEWTRAWYRTYYLFGAIINVPVLALGTIYLLGPRRVGHICAAVVAIASVYAAGAVFTSELNVVPFAAEGIPSAAAVMPDGVRTLSRYYSFAGFFVVVGGALWSAWRLARTKQEHLRHLVTANVLIASGTFVVAVASIFARFGRGSVFAIGLLVGVTMMFMGFLKTRPRMETREA